MSGHENEPSRLARVLRAYRPDRVLWRWFSGTSYLDGVERNDSTFLRRATRDYSPGEFIEPPRTLRAEIRRDVGELRREIRERREQRKRGVGAA